MQHGICIFLDKKTGNSHSGVIIGDGSICISGGTSAVTLEGGEETFIGQLIFSNTGSKLEIGSNLPEELVDAVESTDEKLELAFTSVASIEVLIKAAQIVRAKMVERSNA